MVKTRDTNVIDATRLDRTKLIHDAIELVNVDSPTGSEGEVGELYASILRKLGMKVVMQEVEAGRYNVVATLRGSKIDYATLMFNGHLDTSFAASEDSEVLAAISDVYPGERPWGRLKRDWIYGMGSFNMKSALAAYAAAIRTIQDQGAVIPGDVMICAVIGEIEKSQIDPFRGPSYRGYGHGTAYLVAHGGTADCAILGEPTGLRLMRAHSGSCWFKIGLKGTLVHTGHAGSTPNAILYMNRLITALEKWVPEYQKKYVYRGVKPTVNFGAIDGGWPWRASRTPLFCNLFLDVRFPPKHHPLDIKWELARVLERVKKDTGINPELEIYVTDEWSEVGDDATVCDSLKQAHRKVFGRPVEEVYFSWSSDANILSRHGISAVNYGPSGGPGKEKRGTMYIPNLCKCAQVYAEAVSTICSKERDKIRLGI
jgi:acetylornithine deacetylase/succinyl-diaminopimelate desuccinylase-like protein